MPKTYPVFAKKADECKRPLEHTTVRPLSLVKIVENEKCYQGLGTERIGDAVFPITLKNGDEIIFDFGEHAVGYLNIALNHEMPGRLCDSPIKLRYTFGEFPLEIITPPDEYKGELGSGWLQNEERSAVFMPYNGILERRYSFRYLKIQRLDSAPLNIKITDIFVDAVSAVDIGKLPKTEMIDPVLEKIYDMSVKTLKECEQDVYEDGPKRDRRLWIGDLRLQALTDYGVFRNIPLIKRCIYLFAAHRAANGAVAPCIFPDSPPYTDDWTFCDYSLYFVTCLLDYAENTDDLELPAELYDIAREQVELISSQLDDKKRAISGSFFIDWCNDLDKTVAAIGVYLYVLRQFKKLSEMLKKDGKIISWTEGEISRAQSSLMCHFDAKKGVFITPNGQFSWHSQVWAVLSGALTEDDARDLLIHAEQLKPDYTMHTPYMMNYYIEALFSCGLRDKAMDFIKSYWGEIAELGFDCCPEIFNPENHLESPYNAPEINSACHAWSCTPAYWIKKFMYQV